MEWLVDTQISVYTGLHGRRLEGNCVQKRGCGLCVCTYACAHALGRCECHYHKFQLHFLAMRIMYLN